MDKPPTIRQWIDAELVARWAAREQTDEKEYQDGWIEALHAFREKLTELDRAQRAWKKEADRRTYEDRLKWMREHSADS